MMLLILHGCARLASVPPDEPPARRQIGLWTAHNSDVGPLKGLLQLSLAVDGQSTGGRAAWAAVQPDRLRVEWLNPLGQPLLRMAGDGQTITLLSVMDQKFHRMAQSRRSLERMIHIPVGIEDLVSILFGRPPLPDHSAARLLDGPGCGVVLEGRWRARVAELRSDTCERVQSMVVFDTQGEMRYRIDWLAWQTVQGHVLPRTVQMVAANGSGLTLMMDRYWFDSAVTPETFVITPPE